MMSDTHSAEAADELHVTAAAVCERVLTETDQVPSLIRIIDRVLVALTPGQVGPLHFPFVLFVAFRRRLGGPSKKCWLRVDSHSDTSYLMRPPLLVELEVQAGSHGTNVSMPFETPFPCPGSYWFDISLDGQLMSRAFLNIIGVPAPVITGAPGP